MDPNKLRGEEMDFRYIDRPFGACGQPLCGQAWYLQHRLDYTQADIDAQTIIMKVDNRQMPTVSGTDKKGRVSNIVKINRKS